ncbi:MAG: CHAP domain-containing protein [Moheibacter sp.]
MGWDGRKTALSKLNTWFEYDKNVCDGQAPLVFNEILDDPKLNYVKVAIGFIGTKEISGSSSNTVIDTFFDEIGWGQYKDDTPWCAAFANYCLKKGNPEISRLDGVNAVSFSYAGYEEVNEPFYGSFMVYAANGTFYKAGSKGHVAIVIGKEGDSYAQLGGNQAKPGEDEGLYVNVVLRGRSSKVKYFHPLGVTKYPLGKSLATPEGVKEEESVSSTR